MNPRVTVVISTYNRPEKLAKAIESVRRQTFTDWELIIVQDGHDKGMIPEYDNTDKKITLLQIPHFGNDTQPKNAGILHAKGELVAFLDDDNQFRPDHLAALVSAFNSYPGTDIAYGQRWVIDDAGVKEPGLGKTSDYVPGVLMQENYIDTSDVLIKRSSLVKVGGFDERYSKYIDWNLWVRMEKARMSFKYVPLILTDYFICSDSKSVNKMTKREQEFLHKTGKYINMPDWSAPDLEIRLPFLGKIEEPRVAIFSLTYNRLEYTKKCFESLYETAGYKFDHFVIDNGSTDGTQHYLQELPLKFWEFNEQNRGISKASNQALECIFEPGREPYDIILKVDNDALFLNKGWLAKMVELWKSNHRLALSPYVQGLRDNPGGAPRLFRGRIKGETIGMTEHLGGICTFSDASAYENFRWDENDFLHGMQDTEFSQHLLDEGFQLAYMENWFLEHIEGTQGQENRYPEYFEKRKQEKRTRYDTSKS